MNDTHTWWSDVLAGIGGAIGPLATVGLGYLAWFCARELAKKSMKPLWLRFGWCVFVAAIFGFMAASPSVETEGGDGFRDHGEVIDVNVPERPIVNFTKTFVMLTVLFMYGVWSEKRERIE